VQVALESSSRVRGLPSCRLVDPTSETLLSLPLARIETAANAHGVVAVGLALGHTEEPPADLPRHFRRSRRHAAASEAAGRFVVERPEGRRLDDGFYVRVAKAYRDAAELGLNPRQELARDSGAAPDTVARWVSEARRRGYLPPGRPGKVTA
jgi:hypothetical protein